MHNDLSEMQKSIIDTLVDENEKLQEKVKKLEKRLRDVEDDVDENIDTINNLKVKVESCNQYGRRNNIEISGVPNAVADDDLEGKVVQILNEINVPVSVNDIEACHRLPIPRSNPDATKKVIVRFVNRKHCIEALKVKKDLDNIDMASLDFSEETKLYINENLNRYFSKIGWQCRKLRNGRRIDSYVFKNEAFVIKYGVSGHERKITKECELFDMFPDFFEAVL